MPRKGRLMGKTKKERELAGLNADQLRNVVGSLNAELGRMQDRFNDLRTRVGGLVAAAKETLRVVDDRGINAGHPVAGLLAFNVKEVEQVQEMPRLQLLDVDAPKDGGFVMRMDPPHWAMRMLGRSLGETLGTAKNYTEVRIAIAVTILRLDGKTPHELKLEAFAERDRALAELAALKGETAPPAHVEPPKPKSKGLGPKVMLDAKEKVIRCNYCGGTEPLNFPIKDVEALGRAFGEKHKGCKRPKKSDQAGGR